ncbi:hypothetical protein LIER_40836 [Lithospermum erythrorhizon]|uniref:RRM domain-containing protein n=1 Tax=Lithospermum erythrorhizon TaxID=34254 RepID=A0AAV3R092_LITER
MQKSTAPPSNNLWIGNLSPEVTESDLESMFGKFGEIDSIASYASRSYAFIYYNNIAAAKAAKDSLQGHILRGNPIRIQFAKLEIFIIRIVVMELILGDLKQDTTRHWLLQ